MSSLSEVAHEFCKEVASLQQHDDGEMIKYMRDLVGYPDSSAETVELIELLQTEQSLLHHCVSRNQGHPTAEELSYVNRLQTTKQLLHTLYTSSVKSGFPKKGLGWRTNFAMAAQVEIDRLASDIGSKRSAPSAGTPGMQLVPPGLSEPLGAVSLSSIRASVPLLRTSAASTTAQATPSKVQSKTLYFDMASEAALSPQAILAQKHEDLSRKQKVLENKLKALAGAGVKSLLSSSNSSSGTSSSNSQSKSSSSQSEALTAQSSASTPDPIELKIRAAKFKADRAQTKLEQIQADHDLALLLTEAEIAQADQMLPSGAPSVPQKASGHPSSSKSLVTTTSKQKLSSHPSSSKSLVTTSSKQKASSHPSSPSLVTTTSKQNANSHPSSPRLVTTHGTKNPLGVPAFGQLPLKINLSNLGSEQKQTSDKSSSSTSRPNTPPAAARRIPGSPSPDEAHAIMLQAQLEEVNSRIKASRLLADSSPEAKLKDELATMRLEMELLRKTAMNAPMPPSHIVAAKESDKVAIAGSPSAQNYHTWRDSVEVSVVSASGRSEDAIAFMDEIAHPASPSDLVAACPAHLRGLDAKYACSLRTSLSSAGLPGERVLLKIKDDPEIRFSGRAIQRLADIEFGYLSSNSIAVTASMFQRLKLSGNTWQSLEQFLNQLDSLLIRLKNTSEFPTETRLMTVLEDEVESQLAFTQAMFAAHRQREFDGESISSHDLIKLLKTRCEKHREKQLRQAATSKTGALVATDEKKQKQNDDKAKKDAATKVAAALPQQKVNKNMRASSSSIQYCQNFQIGKCQKGDKCTYAHKPNKEAKKIAEEREAKRTTNDKSKPQQKQQQQQNSGKKIQIPCRYFASGSCLSKNCQFLHDASAAPASSASAGVARPINLSGTSTGHTSNHGLSSACVCFNIPASQPNDNTCLPLPVLMSCPAINNLALDSGAGVHLINPKDSKSVILTHQAPTLRLDTANGVIASNEAAMIDIPLGSSDSISAEVRILRNSPSVLALGRLCVESGYGFAWPPHSEPLLFSPTGQIYQVPLQQFVPVLNDVQQLSPSVAIDSLRSFHDMMKSEPLLTMPAPLQHLTIQDQYDVFVKLKLPDSSLLIEVCTSADSQLGIRAPCFGFYVIRVTEQHDFSSQHTQTLLEQIASRHPGCNSHASLPCTPWSRFQALNMHMSSNQKAYKQRLKRQRQNSIKLVEAYGRLSTPIVLRGGSSTFEWPSTASEGHQHGTVVAMKENASMIHTAKVAACSVKLFSEAQQLMFGKSWQFDCSSPEVANSLRPLVCAGGHSHAITQGSDTAKTAYYPPLLADAYWCGVRAHHAKLNHALPVVPTSPNAPGSNARAGSSSDPPLPVARSTPPSQPAEVKNIVEEVPESKNDALRLIALSTDHMLTHFPKNPFCQHCSIAKQRRFAHRSRTEPRERAAKFGDKILLDSIIATRAEPGFDGSTLAHAIQDDATGIAAAFPTDSKDALVLQDILRAFLGNAIAAHNVVCSDSAPEIASACHAIGVVHLATTPHDSESHGIQEAFNQKLINLTRTVLHTASLPPSFWPQAIVHAAMSMNITPRDDKTKTPYEAKHNCPFPGLKIPFGSLVSWVPPRGENSKFEPAARECLFLGWRTSPGCKFQDYVVMPIANFIDGTHRFHTTKDIAIPTTDGWTFPARQLALDAATKAFADKRIAENPVLSLFDLEEEEEPALAPACELSVDSPTPVPRQSAPTAVIPPVSDRLPPGPVGRPATARPPEWSATEQKRKEWSNLSRAKRDRLTAEYRKEADQVAVVAKFTQALADILASTVPSAPAAPGITTQIPESSDVAWFSPEQHEHRPPEDSGYLSMITRQLTRLDAEYHCPEAVQARETERDRLIRNDSWSSEPVSMYQAKTAHPAAKFCRIFTITGIKDSEVPRPVSEQIASGIAFANEVKKRKFKARSVAQGSNVYDADGNPAIYGTDVSSHASNFTCVRSVAAHGVLTKTPVTTIDADQAFVQPRLNLADPNQQFFVELPPELPTPEQKKKIGELKLKRAFFHLKVPLYGLPIASAMWERHLDGVLGEQGWKPIEGWPQSYTRASSSKTPAPNLCLCFYVDDGTMSGGAPGEQDTAWAQLRTKIRCGDPEPVSRSLGVNFTIKNGPVDSYMSTSMNDYFRAAIEAYEAGPGPPLSKHSVPTPYADVDPELEHQPGELADRAASIVMKLLFGARMTAPHLCYAIGSLATQFTRWSKQCDRELVHLLSYVKFTPFELSGVVRPAEASQIEIHCYPDADLAGSRNSARSISGAITGIASEHSWIALDWHSKRQTATSTSTSESETVSLVTAAKNHVMPLQTLWSAFLSRPVQAVYWEDNSACITIIKAGYSLALRHLAKHHRISLSFAHEVTGSAYDADIRHIDSANQRGDFLTKALVRSSYEAACRMNGIVFLGGLPANSTNKFDLAEIVASHPARAAK